MKILFRMFFVAVILAISTNPAYSSIVAKLNLIIHVVDEAGQPLGNVRLRGGGWIPGKPGETGMDVKTDENGIFKVKFKTTNEFGFLAEKEGYYSSTIFQFFADPRKDIKRGWWQPNPIEATIVLKKKRDPIPMYVKGVHEKVPVYGKPVGYDLVKGDWVSPYGEGEASDFIIEVAGEKNSEGYNGNTMMTVSFSNEKDGLQPFRSLPFKYGKPLGSAFWSAYEAPLDGYESVYEYEKIIAKGAPERKNALPRHDLNFYFRVRTQLDDQGNIEKAMYGKIYRDFYCYYDHFNDEIKVRFIYYLNPDGTRNVEFDKTRNLFHPDGKGPTFWP